MKSAVINVHYFDVILMKLHHMIIIYHYTVLINDLVYVDTFAPIAGHVISVALRPPKVLSSVNVYSTFHLTPEYL